jgi:hypothetical protein
VVMAAVNNKCNTQHSLFVVVVIRGLGGKVKAKILHWRKGMNRKTPHCQMCALYLLCGKIPSQINVFATVLEV